MSALVAEDGASMGQLAFCASSIEWYPPPPKKKVSATEIVKETVRSPVFRIPGWTEPKAR
jgi:hypothetical protein